MHQLEKYHPSPHFNSQLVCLMQGKKKKKKGGGKKNKKRSSNLPAHLDTFSGMYSRTGYPSLLLDANSECDFQVSTSVLTGGNELKC